MTMFDEFLDALRLEAINVDRLKAGDLYERLTGETSGMPGLFFAVDRHEEECEVAEDKGFENGYSDGYASGRDYADTRSANLWDRIFLECCTQLHRLNFDDALHESEVKRALAEWFNEQLTEQWQGLRDSDYDGFDDIEFLSILKGLLL